MTHGAFVSNVCCSEQSTQASSQPLDDDDDASLHCQVNLQWRTEGDRLLLLLRRIATVGRDTSQTGGRTEGSQMIE